MMPLGWLCRLDKQGRDRTLKACRPAARRGRKPQLV
jgi:hypothetical protein